MADASKSRWPTNPSAADGERLMSGTQIMRLASVPAAPRDSPEMGGLDGPACSDSRIETWLRRVRLRRHLARLLKIDPGLVVDIGLTLQEAEQEVQKSFWRL